MGVHARRQKVRDQTMLGVCTLRCGLGNRNSRWVSVGILLFAVWIILNSLVQTGYYKKNPRTSMATHKKFEAKHFPVTQDEDETYTVRSIDAIMKMSPKFDPIIEVQPINKSFIYTYILSTPPTDASLSPNVGDRFDGRPSPTRLLQDVTKKEIDDLYQRSRAQLEICQNNQAYPKVDKKYILIDKPHRVLYCAAPKIGTTSWLLVFAYLTGKVNITLTNQEDNEFLAWKRESMETIGLKYMDKYDKSLQKTFQNDFFKFMFVRNPYERVISAYNDKLARQEGREFYHQRYGKNIIRSYRKNATKESLATGSDVRFPEFFKFVINQVKHGGGDEHWKRMTDICGPCFIHYSMVGRMESFEKDAYIILKAGFNLTQPIKFPENRGGHKTHASHIHDYFKDIPQTDILEFVRLFKNDFLIGNYSSDIPSIS